MELRFVQILESFYLEIINKERKNKFVVCWARGYDIHGDNLIIWCDLNFVVD
jgi:hypothetical protein